jgi:uncharacterized membrane protein HdeD (DUF308 family)
MSELAAPRLAGVRQLCKRAWWAFLIGGLASIAFGVLIIVNPGMGLLVMAMLFAAAVLVDGVVNVVGGVANRDRDGWWLLVLIGVAGVLVGGYALLNPDITIGAFVLMAGLFALLLGVATIMLGWRIRDVSEREWLLYAAGGVSVLFGLLVLFEPLSGAISVIFVIATWAIATGALRVWLALRMRKVATG